MKFSNRIFYQIVSFIVSSLCMCTTDSKPKIGGEVRIAWTNGLVGVDPTKDWGCGRAMKVIRWIYSPLYSYNNPELSIAQCLSHSQDYTKWVFTLKKNCYFHSDPCFTNNPRRVNAYDIKYSFDLAKNIWGKTDLEPVSSIKEIIVIDSSHIEFILNRSDKNFINRLDKEMVYIIPPEAKEKYGENFSFHPIGCGPFCFESWNDKELILVRNANFWAKDRWGQKLPYLDKIVIKFFGDVNQCINALMNNEVDISPLTGNVAGLVFEHKENEIAIKKEYENLFQIIRSSFPSLTILLCNESSNPVFKDPLVKKAINYAINRDEIMKLLSMPFVVPAYGPTLRYFCGFKYEYNPQKARKLLIKAGYENGLSDLIFQYYPNPFSQRLVEVLQSQLAEVGIKTKFSCVSRVALLRGSPKWDFDVISISYNDSTPSAHLSLYYSGSVPWVDFHSLVFDSLWRLYDAEPDSLLLCKMDSLVLEEPPFVFLYWSYPCFIAKKNLESIDPLFYVSPNTWWKNE